MVYGLAPMHHDDECSLAANEVYEELDKGVDRKGLYWSVDEACRDKVHTSYMSRMGSINSAAFSDTRLIHDENEYIGTLSRSA